MLSVSNSSAVPGSSIPVERLDGPLLELDRELDLLSVFLTTSFLPFAIFISAIFAVIINAAPILVASLAALVLAVLTGTLDAKVAYAGFGSGFIWLIVAAFICFCVVINSGLGARIAYRLILFCGKTTLGLGYALVMADALIAAAFPSNTARSGVLYPIALSVAKGAHLAGPIV